MATIQDPIYFIEGQNAREIAVQYTQFYNKGNDGSLKPGTSNGQRHQKF